MEIVKAENDTLRQRVRALERALRARRRDSSLSSVDAGGRQADLRTLDLSNGSGVGGVAGPRERSESQSTTASSHLLGTSAQRESSSRRPMPSSSSTSTTAPVVVPGVTDEDLRVGESAASSLGRG
jgi:type II secretory pathway pseudopilin PulG